MNYLQKIKIKGIWLSLVFYPFFCISLQAQNVIKSGELYSNTLVREFPLDTPFVFNNIIKIKGDLSSEEKSRLLENLQDYWADSLIAQREQRFIFFYIMKRPPRYDSNWISVSKNYMKNYLFAQGYFNSSFTDTSFLTRKEHKGLIQKRQNIGIFITPGKQTIIDSLVYSFAPDSNHSASNLELQRLALESSAKSFITVKKSPWSKSLMAAELERLTNLFRNNGYYFFKRENLIAEIDTTDLLLLDLTIDPFEQAARIAEATARRVQQPTCIVNFTQRRFTDTSLYRSDSSYLRQFYVGHHNFYLDGNPLFDTSNRNEVYVGKNFTTYQSTNLFQPSFFQYYTYQKKGQLYNDKNYFKVLNTLSQIGTWQQVEVRPEIRSDTIDFSYYLTPETKYKFTGNLEASRNTGDFLSSSNLIGISLNFTLRNRNVWRRAIQSSTSFRTGVEFSFDNNSTLIQSTQLSLNKTFSIPHLIFPFKKLNFKEDINFGRTVINANLAYADRINFFLLRSAVANIGHEWRKEWKRKPRPLVISNFKFLNIELYNLDTLKGLKDAFLQNPLLANSFNTGYVISFQGNLQFNFQSRNPQLNHFLRISNELTYPFGQFQEFKNEVYEFVKLEADYRWLYKAKNASWACRSYLGLGYNFGNDPRFGKTLPFFKQFVAGGPNSMRAWTLRQLGLGSSLLSDTSSSIFRDRYGDFQFETNVEYRFQLAHFSAVNINSALFADIGNIWNLRSDPENPQSVFNVTDLGQDLAIAFGTGLRLDFSFFIIRFDLGFKLKDPARLGKNGWASLSDALSWRNRDYDFTNTQPRYNYALQLGIGMPF
jgi:hypothetical protein